MIAREAFAGDWQLSRRIEDRLTASEGRFDGTASLTPEGARGLRYAEAGLLQLAGGPPMKATRVYLWQFGPERVDVRFEDGRAFHSFVPEGEGPGTDHPCGADYYRVTYDLTAWPVWSTDWTVTGPHKSYAMHTRYSRHPHRG